LTVLTYTLQLALGIFLPWWVVHSDQKRLPAEQLARTWNDASFWCAIVVFGPLCIPVHFTKARRSIAGFLLGIVCMFAVLALLAVVDGLGELVLNGAFAE